MLHKRILPEVFPDPDQPEEETVKAVVDWGLELAQRCEVPIPDPGNPEDVADMMTMVGNYCGYDRNHVQSLQRLIRATMVEYGPDYLE